MPKGQRLAEFEVFVMAAAAALADDAYGMALCREIEARTGRRVAIGAVYATIARLEDKGFVTTYGSDPLPVQGGRARRYVRLTASGRRALKQSIDMFARLVASFDAGSSSSKR